MSLKQLIVVSAAFEWSEWSETALVTHVNNDRGLIQNKTRICTNAKSNTTVANTNCEGLASKMHVVYKKAAYWTSWYGKRR